MATEAQIIANRRNSQKSTGLRSPEGKAVVSKNAVKHGLFASEAGIAESGDQETRGSGCGNQDTKGSGCGNQETRESGKIDLLTRYPDNHCLVTRYSDDHYKFARQSQFHWSPNERKLNYNKGL